MDLNEEAVQQYIGRRGRERMVVRLTTTYANQCLSQMKLDIRNTPMTNRTRYSMM